MAQVSSDKKQTKPRVTWNFEPPLPIEPSPYFKIPPHIPSIVKWMVTGWLPVSERLIILLLAIICSSFFQPALADTQQFSLTWVAGLYVRNFLLMCLVAGGLHWYLYIARKQGDDRRYDARPFPTNSKLFTFGSQVRDNVFWTLASGVTVWTAYEALMLWALGGKQRISF